MYYACACVNRETFFILFSRVLRCWGPPLGMANKAFFSERESKMNFFNCANLAFTRCFFNVTFDLYLLSCYIVLYYVYCIYCCKIMHDMLYFKLLNFENLNFTNKER